MVLQHRKDTSLLELLESHTEGYTLEVAIQPLLREQPKKKRKSDRKGKDVTEEGEVVPSKDLEP